MIPGAFLFPYWFYKLNISIWVIIVISIFYLFIITINIQQALDTLKMVHALERALLKNFKNLSSWHQGKGGA
jgi:hypothetical protein